MLRRHLVLFLAFSLAACGKESSSERSPRGPAAQESRAIPAFAGVVASSGRITIKKGNHGPAQLSGPENYLKAIQFKNETRKIGETEVSVLRIEFGLRMTPPPPEIVLTTPDLALVEVSGTSQVTLDDFSRDRIQLKAHDVSSISLTAGTYSSAFIDVGHASRVTGPDVMVEEAHVRGQGRSLVQLGQVARLEQALLQPAKISYKGTPEVIQP